MTHFLHTPVTDKLGIEHPLIQAGMAGGPTTPELVAAVSNQGGLGTLGAGYMTPDKIRTAIRHIRALTDRPFAVNLFIPEAYEVDPEQVDRMNERLQPIRDRYGLSTPSADLKLSESFDEQLEVLLDEKVPVVSFTFGAPTPECLQKLRTHGITTIGTATTVAEAEHLDGLGVDLIVAQGSEAGGHRGTYLTDAQQALIGTMALLPQIVDRVQAPVIAAGGIMDGRGLIAALALGAGAVQLGTAFLTCYESGASSLHKNALLQATDSSTTLTNAFSGKYARGLCNDFIEQLAPHADDIPAYPIQNALTRDIRSAAAQAGDPQNVSLWAGQAAALTQRRSVQELMEKILEQATRVATRFHPATEATD
ncbi:MAG TPA: nitronate monooxygenase [Bacilli bacterium]|nr:nitronate monooxygenase [Bacilli bacterium]